MRNERDATRHAVAHNRSTTHGGLNMPARILELASNDPAARRPLFLDAQIFAVLSLNPAAGSRSTRPPRGREQRHPPWLPLTIANGLTEHQDD